MHVLACAATKEGTILNLPQLKKFDFEYSECILVVVFSDYSYPYATLVFSILSTAVVLAKNKITVSI